MYHPMRAVMGRLGCSSKERQRVGSPWLQSDVKTTMMYIHALNRGPGGVRSPLDGLVLLHGGAVMRICLNIVRTMKRGR